MYLSRMASAGGSSGNRLNDVIRHEVRRAVDYVHSGRGPWFIAVAMAGPARHHLAAPKLVLIDGGHHVHHPARHHLCGSVGGPIDRVSAGIVVTIRTVKFEGGRHEPHGLQKIVDRNPLERLNVLEDLSAGAWPFRGRGQTAIPSADHRHNRHSCDSQLPSLRPELHILPHLLCDGLIILRPDRNVNFAKRAIRAQLEPL